MNEGFFHMDWVGPGYPRVALTHPVLVKQAFFLARDTIDVSTPQAGRENKPVPGEESTHFRAEVVKW